MTKRILVTGGCGFIGSNFVRECLCRGTRSPFVVVLDSLTYAGSLDNLADSSGYIFVKADIRDAGIIGSLIKQYDLDTIVHFAAETHVDRSIAAARQFFDTNVIGTANVLNELKDFPNVELVFVSTDEVYGDASLRSRLDEDICLRPSSPYSASKAAADLLVQTYIRTYGVKAKIVRPCNAFGPYQFPEKLIPLTISNMLHSLPMRLYGDGLQRRDWVFVEDLCEQIWLVLHQGRNGAIYNLGEPHNVSNLDIVHEIFRCLNEMGKVGGTWDHFVEFTEDRLGHDRAYMNAYNELRKLGWTSENTFRAQLRHTVGWYLEAGEWLSARG